MIYTIQDREQDKLLYIASVTTAQAANDLLKELYEQDEKDGCLDKSRYIVKRRGLCYSDTSKKCGLCTNCVCMADNWETECPARVKNITVYVDSSGAKSGLSPAT